MRQSLLSRTAIAAVGAAVLWGCGGGGGGSASTPTSPTPTATAPAPTPTATARTITVAIVTSSGNGAFQPNPVSASTGDTVMFRNNDSVIHRLVMDDGSMDFGDINPGSTSTRGLLLSSTNPATFHCTLHRTMVGSVNGTSAPTPPCVPDSYGYGC